MVLLLAPPRSPAPRPVAATVSTASTSFGRVLIVGSGANAGCSLYILTSDQLHSLTFGLAAFACSDGPNPIGQPCDSVLWPALLTKGAPIAGPGVNRSLLGTVTRTDVLSGAERAAGDLRRSAAVPVLPGRDAGANGRGQPVRPSDQSHRHLVPGGARSRPSRARSDSDAELRRSAAPRCWRHRWTTTSPSCRMGASPSTP